MLVAHEVGHALSRHCRKPGFGPDTGFRCHELDPDGTTYRLTWRSKWLDEGVTVLWEELSVNDGSTLPERDDAGDIYPWYREAVRALMAALNLDQDTMLRAYFGNEAACALLEARVRQRFNCALGELDVITLLTEIDFTRKLFRGEPVRHQLVHQKIRVLRRGQLVSERQNSELIAKWRKLAQIFPNLTLIEPIA